MIIWACSAAKFPEEKETMNILKTSFPSPFPLFCFICVVKKKAMNWGLFLKMLKILIKEQSRKENSLLRSDHQARNQQTWVLRLTWSFISPVSRCPWASVFFVFCFFFQHKVGKIMPFPFDLQWVDVCNHVLQIIKCSKNLRWHYCIYWHYNKRLLSRMISMV